MQTQLIRRAKVRMLRLVFAFEEMFINPECVIWTICVAFFAGNIMFVWNALNDFSVFRSFVQGLFDFVFLVAVAVFLMCFWSWRISGDKTLMKMRRANRRFESTTG